MHRFRWLLVVLLLAPSLPARTQNLPDLGDSSQSEITPQIERRIGESIMREIRRVAGRRIGLSAYRWMLDPAMAVLRNEPELVLKSRWAVPRVLTEAGFRFRHPELGPALDAVASVHRPRARDLFSA